MAIDKDRPSTWRKYRAGLCENCMAGCCTMPVEVHISDLVRLGVVSQDEADASIKKVAKQLIREGIVSTYRQGTGLFMLTQRDGGDCYFLDKNRLCTVYERRPEVCRKFPDIGPRPGWCPASSKKKTT
jgi:uncharacterized protein